MSTHKNQSTQLKRFAFCGKKHQTGVATILVVLLVSVALAATTFGVVSSLKNTQQLQVSSQTINQAQSSAWMLAEATRRYLSTLNLAALQALDGQPLTLAPPTANDPIKTLLTNSSILINSVTPDPTSGQRVDVSIKAIDTHLQASSNLNLVFVVQPGQSSTSICEDGMAKQLRGKVPNSNMQYSDNSKEGGFIVDGSIASNNNQVTLNGVDSLHATGSIALKGTTMETLELIKANDDITLEGAINADVVLSGGDVRISNNSNVRKIVASGSIYWESSGTTSDLQAGESITVLNGTHVNSLSLLDTTLNFTNGNWANILSHADLVFNSNTQAISASAYGDVRCTVKPTITTLLAGGTTSPVCGRATPPPAPVAGSLPEPEAYDPIVLDIEYLADADSYEANYHFFYDGTTKVRIRNVNGIADGDYVVYDKNGAPNLADFIHPVGGAPATTDPALCNSNNNTVGCINFTPTGRVEPTNDTVTPAGYWEITANDPQLAPGVVYFDRDLRLNGGGNSVLFNSFLVAGNVQITGGNPTVVSLNSLKTTELCGNVRSAITEINKTPAAFKVLAPQAYPYPTNFCKSATERGDFVKGGDFALLAGQNNGAEVVLDKSKATPQYQGGDIFIKSSSIFMGDVLAGNAFKFDAGTNIKFYGAYGSEAQREGVDEAKNEMGDEKGTTNIEVFDPRNTGEKPEEKDCKPKTGATGETRLLWSRFQ